MTTQKSDGVSEAMLIRALIIARGPDGASLQEIKKDYKEQVGKELSNGEDDYSLRKWLERIAHVTTGVRGNQIKYFSEAPEQEHLSKMIRKQRKSSRNYRSSRRLDLSNVSEYHDNTLSTPRRFCDKSFHRRNQLSTTSIKNDTFKRPLTPKKVPRSLKKERLNSSYMRFFEDQDDFDQNNNISSCTNMNLSRISNMTIATDRFMELEDNVDPFRPEFFKCILVGDTFLLNTAVIDLHFRMFSRQRVLQSGYCVSGQTIDDATIRIESMEPNQIILINIGSMDIVLGSELIEMIISMMRLLHTCKLNSITPILTTLAPLGNYRLGNRAAVTSGFNEFLMKNPFDAPVIDLHKAFFNSDGAMDPNCFQNLPRFASGIKKPLVYWNQLGRQRVLKTLKEELGSAMLKILLNRPVQIVNC